MNTFFLVKRPKCRTWKKITKWFNTLSQPQKANKKMKEQKFKQSIKSFAWPSVCKKIVTQKNTFFWFYFQIISISLKIKQMKRIFFTDWWSCVCKIIAYLKCKTIEYTMIIHQYSNSKFSKTSNKIQIKSNYGKFPSKTWHFHI